MIKTTMLFKDFTSSPTAFYQYVPKGINKCLHGAFLYKANSKRRLVKARPGV